MTESLTYKTPVRPEWIDHNGHMNVAFYVLAFDEATDAAYEKWGIGLDYPDTSGCSVFTLGMNVDYLSEVFKGDSVTITTKLVDRDMNRIHYFHEMTRDATGIVASRNECLCINVNLATRKAASFPAEVIDILTDAQSIDDVPDGFGRQLGILRK